MFTASHILCHFGCGPLMFDTWSRFYQQIPPEALAVNWKRLWRRAPCWSPSSYETPICHLLVHHIRTFVSYMEVWNMYDSNDMFIWSCMHTWSYNANVCMCLPWSQPVLLENKVLVSGRKIWWRYINGIVSDTYAVLVFKSYLIAIHNAHWKWSCLTRTESMTWGQAKVVAGKRPLDPQRS